LLFKGADRQSTPRFSEVRAVTASTPCRRFADDIKQCVMEGVADAVQCVVREYWLQHGRERDKEDKRVSLLRERFAHDLAARMAVCCRFVCNLKFSSGLGLIRGTTVFTSGVEGRKSCRD
jgi:hypothetical protein